MAYPPLRGEEGGGGEIPLEILTISGKMDQLITHSRNYQLSMNGMSDDFRAVQQ